MQLFYALLRQSASMSRAGTRRTDAVSDDPGVDGLTSREAEVLKTLKAEADRVAEKLHSLYMARESVITLTATATGGVIALTGSTARYAAILLLPYVLLGLTAYAADRANEMRALGGYGRALEDRVNQLLGQPCLMWESHIAGKVRNTPRCTWPLRMFRIGALVSSAGAALWAAMHPDRFIDTVARDGGGTGVSWLYIAGGVAVYLGGIVAALSLFCQNEQVGEEAYRLAGGPHPASAADHDHFLCARLRRRRPGDLD
jgi:hypothetical protein